jgi:hypothetical protein
MAQSTADTPKPRQEITTEELTTTRPGAFVRRFEKCGEFLQLSGHFRGGARH